MTETIKYLGTLTDDDTSFERRQQMIEEVNAAICLEKRVRKCKSVLIEGLQCLLFKLESEKRIQDLEYDPYVRFTERRIDGVKEIIEWMEKE